jgi:diacylglycerol kinase (ATP)
MRTFVVINPAAGGGKSGHRWPGIRGLLEDAIGPFDHAMTSGRGDATILARHAIAEGAGLVIAIGGDGTVNEIINGFAGRDGKISKTCALGIVPSGTGSDFMRGLGGMNNALSAIEKLRSRQERWLDVGRVEFTDADGGSRSRLFLNAASFGFSGLVCHNMTRSRPRPYVPARVAYLGATFSALKSFRPVQIRIDADGKIVEKEVMLAALANGRYFGAGMMIAPDANIQDGLLDVVVLKPMSKLQLVRKIAHVYRGTHLALPEIEYYRARRISAECPEGAAAAPVHVEADGESAGRVSCRFSVERQALRFLQ